MPTVLSGLIRRLKTELAGDGEAVTDGVLLERFLSRHDEDAFAVLLRRHGPMVLGVCRRLLRDPHDADDAFQATFLVAVRKAASVRPRELFGNWLYGVAYRTALEARARLARRRAKEKQTDDMPHPPQAEPDADGEELRRLLDRELSRLPEKYRVPVVLCDLEGRSRRDVARQLRLPEGTLSSRLATARKTLARRLARHGPARSGTVLAAVVAGGACADVPAALAQSTIKGAVLVSTGRAALAAVAAPQVVALTEGVLKAMLLTKLKVASLFVLALAAVVAGAGLAGYRTFAADPDRARQADAREADEPKAKDKPRPADGGDEAGKGSGKEVTIRIIYEYDSTAPHKDVIKGSGKEVTKELKLADFTSVDVGSVFQLEITQGKAFRVAITADDNVIDYIKAAKDDAALKIGLDGERRSFQNVTLKAVVTMPRLEGLTVSGASQVTLSGFKSQKDCKFRVDGASSLKGDLQAATVDLAADGAGTVTLKGSAKKAKLSGDGAATLKLAEFTADSADVTLTGASQATVQVKSALDYDLSGASHLEYGGEPKVGKKQTTGASSAGTLPRP
jgi:RNA polymerase sigma factor (sigma-70 family)